MIHLSFCKLILVDMHFAWNSKLQHGNPPLADRCSDIIKSIINAFSVETIVERTERYSMAIILATKRSMFDSPHPKGIWTSESRLLILGPMISTVKTTMNQILCRPSLSFHFIYRMTTVRLSPIQGQNRVPKRY